MARYKVVVTDQVFPDVDTERELLSAIDAELSIADGTVDGVVREAGDADALLNTYLPVDAALLKQLPNVRVISRYGIGVDNIDVAAAAAADVVVTNVPDYCVEEVAAHTVAMMLSLLRKLPTADRSLRDGAWGITDVRPLRRLSELTVGLVGYGRISRRVADALRPFGFRIVTADPYVTSTDDGTQIVELDELFEQADAVSLHAPLTPETRGMVNAEVLGRMRPSAVLVNTSRGPLVELDALAAALREGRLAGAALDVFETEPIDADRVRDVPNLLVSPHMAYYSEEALKESQRKATTQVVKVLSGQEPDYAVRA
jgi:D-3-phosphoglycerate dehydrogenase